MRKMFWVSLIGTMTLMGCNKGSVDDISTDDTDEDTDNGQNNDGFTPYVEDGFVYCIDSQQSAGIIWNWSVQAQDEQGPFTIKSLNEVGAYTVKGDSEIFRQKLLACNDEGQCSGSLREDQAGILCSNHEQYVFKAYIEDDDGNVSEPFIMTWSDSVPD